ncbi:hypothetical protein G195_003026 [Phytophthora kernoviae 00238/432]|uniref:Major facilitator superfamily (MFS) profile domain-containing protein n=1 Tax=Phytophthora kernoviae 00238/432 TaxID=1284355 RepID=A0A8J4SQA2_9STRA|nr:hypothetical protein G195_003026 [Phytophthora kernoviae 00238/432]
MSTTAAAAPSSAMDNIKKGPIVAALLIGAFVAFLNQTLMNVALPKIMEDLGIGANKAQWLTTGYMLVNGTLVCGLSPNFGILMVGRVIQAAGAGILMPLMTVVFLTIFPIEKRGQAMGTMGIAMILAPAIGPTLSGYVVEHYSWRLLFYIILPFSIIATGIGIAFVKNVTRQSKPKLDYPGVILSTLGFGSLLYGFSDAGTDGWGSAIVIACLIVGAVSLILFVIRQMTTDHPLLEFRIFKYNMYTLTTIINMLVTMAMFAGMILLPIFLQNIRGFSPIESGLLMMPGAILMGIMSPITGRIFDKVGARWLSVAGLAITAITTWGLSRLSIDTTYGYMMFIYTARMFGMSMLMMPIQTAGLNQLPQRLNAHGTAMSNTLRTVAGAIGTAILVTIMSSKLKSHLADTLATGQIAADDKAAMLRATADATIYGVNYAFVVATAMTVVALLLAFFIRKTKPATEPVTTEQQKVNATA